MKKALRTLVPLLLAVAVLVSMAWYLLIYDREFTKEMILWTARTLEEDGRHEAAAWFYDLAYSHSSQEDAVAIELAQQYRDYGNYTKAEFTLTEAISKNPTADLYIALSKLYVEQDKLLDAVKMLDSVNDPQISARLETLRPATPNVSYAPGFYSQYIDVEVLGSGGLLYVSTDAEYPSTATDLYAEAISLGLGETTLHCLCVGDNGLVSDLGLYGYTVGGVVEPVSFTDEAIETAVRQLLNTGANTTIYTNDLWTITEFAVPIDAKSFTDLSLLTKLETLSMDGMSVGVLAQMGNMPTLKHLSMPGSRLSEEDMAALAALTALETLDLSNCSISTISGLETLTKLKTLDLSSNAVRNLTALSGLTGVQQLNLAHNAVNDLSALSGLVNMEELDVSHNSLTTLNSVSDITALTTLKASHNQIANVDALKQLVNLTVLDISYNTVVDVSALAACTAMSELDISNNMIADVTALSTMKNLTLFNLSHNQVDLLPAFHKDCTLVTIDASYNLLSSIEQLAGLDDLNTVNIDYNEAIETLEPLDSCHVLIQVNAHGTKVTEVEFLTDKSIVVNYDPTI